MKFPKKKWNKEIIQNAAEHGTHQLPIVGEEVNNVSRSILGKQMSH